MKTIGSNHQIRGVHRAIPKRDAPAYDIHFYNGRVEMQLCWRAFSFLGKSKLLELVVEISPMDGGVPTTVALFRIMEIAFIELGKRHAIDYLQSLVWHPFGTIKVESKMCKDLGARNTYCDGGSYFIVEARPLIDLRL